MYTPIYDEGEILQDIDSFVAEGDNPQAKAMKLLIDTLDYYDWVGIYEVDGDYLNLGAFEGAPTDHTRIPIKEGICGAAVANEKTLIIQDVLSDPRHIACSATTRSEIVVPIWLGEKIVAEIDVDSNTPNAFSDWDKKLLEKVAEILSECYQ